MVYVQTVGSWARLLVGDFIVAEWKEWIDPQALSVFQPTDRQIIDADTHGGKPTSHQYATRARHALERLELMGFNRPRVARVLRDNLAELRQRNADTATDGSNRQASADIVDLDLDMWIESITDLRAVGLTAWDFEVEVQFPVLHRLINLEGGAAYGFPTTDPRYLLRAALETSKSEDEVILDFSQLVEDEIYPSLSDVRNEQIREWERLYGSPLYERLIVLTEGSTDASFLRATIELRRPHLNDYITFPDFSGTFVEGGAGALTRTIKSFISAGIRNRVVALFDNDTGARSAIRGLRGIALPPSVRIVQLPHIQIGEHYPTQGPQGTLNMNVNGLAGSLELYFGREILQEADGSLTPVVWTSYDKGVGSYQGELYAKDRLQDKYMRFLRICRLDPRASSRHDWEGMDAVLDAIIYAFG